MGRQYIVPPGLRHKVSEFRAHFQVAGGAPIMICGPSGVGKSLFLKLATDACREACGPKTPVLTVNCSHFDGDMARSELFGHVKGAFTGAVTDKLGWIRKAHGGVLILEEIGELPREVQAQLLTFIEDGLFHRVGSSDMERADVRIFAATNNEEALREDFRYRFFPFYVPALYQRRQDVLYYMAGMFPDLVRELCPWEVLTLLAYDWPGNVREIERVGRIMQRRKVLGQSAPVDLAEEAYRLLRNGWLKSYPRKAMRRMALKSGLQLMDTQSSGIRAAKANRLHLTLEEAGLDAEGVEAVLAPYGVNLSVRSKEQWFRDIPSDGLTFASPSDESVRMIAEYKPFRLAAAGLRLFCALFWVSETAPKNLLDLDEFDYESLPEPAPGLELGKRELAIMESILAWRTTQSGEVSSLGLGTMTRTEVLTAYCREILKKAGGNQARAAKLAGVPYTTFRDQLKKLNLP